MSQEKTNQEDLLKQYEILIFLFIITFVVTAG